MMSRTSRHSDREIAGVNLGLIITPMLDMSFQILAFFIMTYHPSALEGSVNGDLVPPSRVKTIGPVVDLKDPGISVDEPDLSETVSVIVHAVPRGGIERHRGDGQPAAIYLKRTEDIDPVLVADSDEPLTESLAKLKRKLQRIQTVGDRKLRLDCQPDLKNRYVIEIYDVCKGAGFEKISFVAPVAPKNEVK